jgi:hypothetical protein
MFFRLTLALLFLSSAATAQQLIGRDLKDNLFIKASTSQDQNYESIEGSPFLDAAFVPGEIITLNMKFPGIPMRYNIFSDQIEFKQNNSSYILAPEARIKQVHIGAHTFIAEEHEVKGRLKLGFLTLLDSGKVSLMAKKIVVYNPKTEPTALAPLSSPAKFTRSQDIFYYKIGNAPAHQIFSLKDLIKSLPGKQDEVNQFAKKEKISVKKEVELLKLIRYYNAL